MTNQCESTNNIVLWEKENLNDYLGIICHVNYVYSIKDFTKSEGDIYTDIDFIFMYYLKINIINNRLFYNNQLIRTAFQVTNWKRDVLSISIYSMISELMNL